MTTAIRVIFFTILLSVFPLHASAENFTDAIHSFLQHRVEIEKRDVGIVVGIMDANGSSIISYGKLDNGTDQQVNGDTVFELGSITKTFTGLLLQDMVDRGQMKLDDPVAKYLPKSVKMPTYNGKEITLLHLATHTSGLPATSVTWTPKRADNPRADYTIERLYNFLSDCNLTREPGTKYEYSTVGTALLGHTIALKAGSDYESLVVERICRPLKMDSTLITLTPEMKTRFAAGHNPFGYAVSNSYWGALAPGAAFRSTANDLLKYVSANIGITPSDLTPLMKKTHLFQAHQDINDIDIGLTWDIMRQPDGSKIIAKSGATDGFASYIAFSPSLRRGIVVLCNCQDFDVFSIGKLLLESQWQSDKRLKEKNLKPALLDSYVGQYRQSSHSPSDPCMNIYRQGDRLFTLFTVLKKFPFVCELLPESENCFFERLSCTSITFSRDAQDKVTGLTMNYQGIPFSYEKISDTPQKVPEPVKPSVAVKLDTKLLDAVVGQYEFAPNKAFPTGMKLTIWREGEQLTGQASGENIIKGAFDIYPESQTTFFIKLNGAQLTFIKNDQGQATAVTYHFYAAKFPDIEGKKLKNSSE
jgi:serine-type D-Ala-D-Ala carboxypeptidase/endopeptidase